MNYYTSKNDHQRNICTKHCTMDISPRLVKYRVVLKIQLILLFYVKFFKNKKVVERTGITQSHIQQKNFCQKRKLFVKQKRVQVMQ